MPVVSVCVRKKREIPGNDLLFHPVARAVPSALVGLTAVFGMGTGVSPPLWSPDISLLAKEIAKSAETGATAPEESLAHECMRCVARR